MIKRLFFVVVFLAILCFANGQNFLSSIDRVEQINPQAKQFEFRSKGVERENWFRAWTQHIQGVAATADYFYIVRNRPTNRNYQQLIIVDRTTNKAVNQLTLDSAYVHPGGISIYDNILVVPFENKDKDAKINFYSLENPLQPQLLGEYLTDSRSAICVGLTSYGDNYLLSRYCGREGLIKFYHFDRNFNKIAEQTWSALRQNRENWQPHSDWNDDNRRYESMNLVQVRADSLSVPNYYLIMFRNNPNAIDLFSISQPNLTDSLDIQLIARREVFPRSTSFRMGVGLRIVDIDSIEVFSAERHINRKSVIEIFGNK